MSKYSNKKRKPGKTVAPKMDKLPNRMARTTITEKEPVEGALSARAHNDYRKDRPKEEPSGFLGSLMRIFKG